GYNGGGAFAFDRTSMLAGHPATFVKFSPLGPQYGGLLPADVDGHTAPPPGAPEYFAAVDTSNYNGTGSTLQVWKFHVDFANPSNSTFTTSPTLLPVTPYTCALCGGSGLCVPQPVTNARLATL